MTTKNLLKFALAAFYFVSLASAQWTGDINVCEDVADNMFIADISNCSNYYICINQQPIQQYCDGGLFFNGKGQSCVASNKDCLTCDPSALSITKLDKTCNKYVMCYAGVPVLRQCCDDLQLDSNGACDLATKVDCVENQCTIQNDARNILYIPSAASCNSYYICMSGTAVPQTCAKDLQFNTQCNCCDVAANANCTIKAAKTSLKRTTHPAPLEADIGCPQTGTHFYPHANTNQYYVCVNGKGAIFTCAEGLFYDSQMQECRQLKNILLN